MEYLNLPKLAPSTNIIYKYGCDGMGNGKRYVQFVIFEFTIFEIMFNASYKQTFFDEDEDGQLNEYSDANIFSFSMVPLRLVACSDNAEQVLWNNSVPSSVALCRPIRLVLRKESSALSKSEVARMKKEVEALSPTLVEINGIESNVFPKMIFSMVDTKVVNDITDTSSQACFICKKSGKRLSDELDKNDRMYDPDNSHVFSPLHAMIRSMEHLLNIAYRFEEICLQISSKNWI